MDQVIDTLKLFLGVTYFCIVSSFKAFLPNGVLPRKSVQGKRVLITGAGSGLGRLMAIEFAKLGSELVLWDINEAGNNETKKLVEEAGGKASAYTVDLSKFKEIHRVSNITKEEVGDIDILINNAGIVTGKKIFDCPDELMETDVVTIVQTRKNTQSHQNKTS